MSDLATLFGKNLACSRRRQGISQEELSIRASLHRTEVSQIERGLRLCRIDTLVKLAGSLDVSPAELLDGMGWTPGDVTYGSFVAASED